MDILQLGAQLLRDRMGIDLDPKTIQSALGGLLAGSDGQIDIAGLVAKFAQQGGLQSVVSSWLGDGANQGIDAGKIMDMFGKQKLGDFSSKLGVEESTAAGGLADVIPQLIDKASSGGSILESLGGAGGLAGSLGGLFGKGKSLF